MIGDDVTNHPRSPWQARLARLRKAWMMEELQGRIGSTKDYYNPLGGSSHES